ncbi:IPT/TIG domain-containing protein [Streptomyces nigrescens]
MPEIEVTIDGSGLAQGAAVRFKDTAVAGPVTVKSPTQIVAAVPSRLPAPKAVDVTVTVGVATSLTGLADECTYAGGAFLPCAATGIVSPRPSGRGTNHQGS